MFQFNELPMIEKTGHDFVSVIFLSVFA